MKNVTILNDLTTLNKLHTSSVESYTTNNGIVDFTCDNAGYVDNVTIKGKTLVNLANYDMGIRSLTESSGNIWTTSPQYGTFTNSNGLITFTTANESWIDFGSIIPVTEGTSIRFIVNIIENGGTKTNCIAMFFNDVPVINSAGANVNKIISLNKVGTTTSLGLQDNQFKVPTGAKYALFIVSCSEPKTTYKFDNFMLLENNEDDFISYFEGLKSVGQGDNIEVLTTPIHNNLIPQNYTKGEGYWNSMIDVGSVVSDSNWYRILEYIPVKSNTKYTGLYTGTQVVYYDENKNTIYHNQSDLVLGYEYHIFTTPQNAKYIRVSYPKDKEGNICIFEGVKHDKKQISTTLRSLPNGVKDTIEKRGNKYVKVQRCGESVISPDLIQDNDSHVAEFSNVARLGCYLKANFNNKTGDIVCLSDKFNYIADYELDKEHFYISNTGTQTNFFLFLNKSKLSGFDLNGFKNYLKENPLTVVYELKTPIITELPNFNPQTYKGENTLIVNSGVIQCDASFDVCEGIRSELDEVKNKVSSLDCDYVEDIELQFLNGWIKNTNGYYSAKMINGVAYINLLCSGGIGTAGTPICYIKDQKFRPKTNIPIIIGTNDGLYVNAFIQVTGNIVIDNVNIPPNLWISICVSYPIL